MTDRRPAKSAATKGRYVIRQDGDEAELTYSITTPTLVIADHTGVPDSFRGTGAGLALLTRLVADARAGGFQDHAALPLRQRHAAQASRMGGCVRGLTPRPLRFHFGKIPSGGKDWPPAGVSVIEPQCR